MRGELDTVNHVLVKVGFKIPDLLDPNFLDGLPNLEKPEHYEQTVAVDAATMEVLKSELVNLASLSAQDRGYAFEGFLNRLFKAFGLNPRSPFRLVGEQIDGSLQLDGDTYLVEATWQDPKVGQAKLGVFYTKVLGKAEWSRGLLISYSGFTDDGLKAFSQGKRTNIVCLEGLDLHESLNANVHLEEVIQRKARAAAETNRAFVPFRELFP